MAIGSNAALPCVSCGGTNLLTARFCCACGLLLHGEARAPELGAEGERKIVTVLFADIQGSLALIGERDPEQAQEILDGVVALLCTCTHRFGGLVSQNLGDGIMALFGAPLAQEDHADRACRAGSAMLEAIAQRNRTPPAPERIAVRVGVASGEVVLRAIRSDRVEHYSAVGTVTHLAARLQGLAPPGSAWLAAGTRRLLRRDIPLWPVGSLPIPGLARAVEVFALAAELTAASPRATSTPSCAAARFVGRRRELAVLRRSARDALAGRGRSVAVVGEAGVGKSRLVREFLRPLPSLGHRVLCASGATYGSGTPWLPMAGLLRELFDLPAGRPDGARVAIAAGLSRLGLDPAKHATALLACADLLDEQGEWIALHHDARRQRVRGALDAVLAHLAAESTVVLVLEDLHDFDRETLAFLEEFSGRLSRRRVLVLATTRPPFGDRWRGNADEQIDLAPLHRPHAEELALELLGQDPSLRIVVPQLVERTGGNPFFLEESVRELAGAGRLEGQVGGYRLLGEGQLPLPASVQGTLAARIDRLPAMDRELLRAAATVGERFERHLLEAVAGCSGSALDAGLGRLAAGGFLAGTGKGHRFCHALTREAAYAGMLQRRRRALHREIVAALQRKEDAAPAGRSERLAQMAHHASAGELWETAFGAFRGLAERALERSAAVEALVAAERALYALAQLPNGKEACQARVDLHFLEADARFALGDQPSVKARVGAAHELARELGDKRRVVRALSRRALAHWACGELDEATEACREGRAIADALADLELRVNTAFRLGTFFIAKGEYRRSVEPLAWVIGAIPPDLAGERFGLVSVAAVAARAALARALGELLDLERGEFLAREAMAMATRFAHPFTSVFASQEVGLFFIRAGDLQQAVGALRVGHVLCRGAPTHVLLPATAAELGYGLVRLGEVGEGLALLEEAVASAARIGLRSQQAQQIGFLAEACLRTGDPGRAEHLVVEALALAREKGERGDEAWLLLLAGDVAAATVGTASEIGRRWVAQAHALGQELGLLTLLRRCGESNPSPSLPRVCDNSQRIGTAAA